MTFRTLLTIAALLVPMLGLAADDKEQARAADLTVALKLGKTKAIIITGARDIRAVDDTVASVAMGESNQVLVEGLAVGETSAFVARKGEPAFKLVIQVVR